MTGWAWHLATDGDLVADLGHATQKQATWALSAAGTASFTLDGADPVASLVQELVSDLVVSYDGDPLWRGRVGATTDTIGPGSHDLVVNAVDYRGVMERRLTTVDATRNLGPAAAAWQAIDALQSRTAGAMGITLGSTAPGDARVLASEWGETLTAIIDRWSKLYPGGFDWWIDGDRKFQSESTRGDSRDWALVYGETVTGLSRSFDPSKYANVVRASGAEAVTPEVAEVADLASRPEKRWETQVGDINLESDTEVEQFAANTLLRTSTLAPDYRFTVTPGTWTPDEAWVGDVLTIRVRSGRLDVDTVDRVQAVTVTDNDSGDVDVQIDTGTDLRRDLARMLRSQADQLAVLTRR